MHAGMVARALIEPGIRIPVTVSIASEFRYETPLIDEKDTGDRDLPSPVRPLILWRLCAWHSLTMHRYWQSLMLKAQLLQGKVTMFFTPTQALRSP